MTPTTTNTRRGHTKDAQNTHPMRGENTPPSPHPTSRPTNTKNHHNTPRKPADT